MLKIRLMRIGAKKKPFYRVVVVDERNKRTGGYIENVGTYNPLTNPKEIKLEKDRIEYWIKKGAQKSDGFLRILGEAPQRPPRKPKKEKKAEPTAVSSQPTDKTEKIDQIKSEDQQVGEPATQPAPGESAEDTEITSTISDSTDAPISSDLSEKKESKDEGSS